jgi:hypothetical protein
MLKKLWCSLFGHKFIAKAFTGNTMDVVGPLGNAFTSCLYKYEAQKWCLRCGTPNPHKEK